MPGYDWYGNNRKDLHPRAVSGSGGVGVLVKQSLTSHYLVELIDRNHEGILWIKFTDKVDHDFSFLICAVYLLPEGSSRGNVAQEFYDMLLTQVYTYWSDEPLLICGDLNGRIGRKVDNQHAPARACLDETSNKYGGHLIEFLEDISACVLNGRLNAVDNNYTYVTTRGKSVVDYIICPLSQLSSVLNFEVKLMSDLINPVNYGERCRVSDHSLLISKWCLSGFTSMNRTHRGTRQINRPTADVVVNRMYTIDPPVIDFLTNPRKRNALLNMCNNQLNALSTQDEVDEVYDRFVSECHAEMNEMFSYKDYKAGFEKKTNKFKAKPWWCAELDDLWKGCKDAERNFLRFKGNRAAKRQRRTEFKNCRKAFDKRLRKCERQYRAKQLHNIDQLRTENPRQFWREIRKLGPGKVSQDITAVRLENGEISRDIEQVMDRWVGDFEKLYNSNPSTPEMMDIDVQVAMPDCPLNQPLTRLEVWKAIGRLKNRKATGIDNIPNEVLKCTHLTNVLYTLLNKIFLCGRIPKVWRETVIHPIHKKGKDPLDPLSYRGISLNSTVSKLYSSVLNNRLSHFIDRNNLLCDEQNGFRSGRSCLDHLFTLTSVIRNRKLQKKPTFACYIDFAKAFDVINRPLLLHKLRDLGIVGQFLQSVKSMYTDNTARIRIHGHLSKEFRTSCGVRQGDCLSPTLFALYLNDLAEHIKSLNLGVKINGVDLSLLLYADDIVLISDSEQSLQVMINVVNEWCKRWQMNINSGKTKIMHFRQKSRQQTDYVFTFGAEQLEVVNSYRYLGIELDYSLDYTVTSDTLASAGSKALGSLIATHFNSNGLPFETYSKVYHNTVVPILDYGAGVWSNKTYKKCEQIDYRAMRTFLGVGKFSALPSIVGDMGWTSTGVRQHVEMIRLWFRLVSMPETRITKKVFRWDYDLSRTGKANWCKDIKAIFNSVNLGYYYENIERGIMTPGRVRGTVKDIERELVGVYERHWKEEIMTMPKLRTYCTLKKEIKTEDYIRKQMERRSRSIIAKLRNGTFPINIELGRYRGIPLEERTCNVCDVGSIESEQHFLLDCPAYNEQRRNLMDIAMGIPGFAAAAGGGRLALLLSRAELAGAVAAFCKSALRVRNKK